MKCNLCNGDAIKENPIFWNSPLYDKNRPSLYHCKNCGVVFVRPMPSEKVNFYNLNGGKANLNPLINFFRYYTLHLWITYFLHNKGEILDFGCGKGEFVFYLRQKDWRAYGVDPNLKTAFTAQFSSNKDYLFSSLTYLKQNNKNAFDAIILNYSLEHCNNPLLVLKELRELLIPKGLIFIRIPNFDCISKNKRLTSFQLKISLHRYFFSIESLEKILKLSGFISLEADTRFCVTSTLTAPCSIFPELDPMDWLYEKRMAVKLVKGLTLGILCLIFSPYELLKSRIGQGAIIHAVARKDV